MDESAVDPTRPKAILYSAYNVHLDGGTIVRLSLTSEQAKELFDAWAHCQDVDEIMVLAEPSLQGVRLLSISAIVKEN